MRKALIKLLKIKILPKVTEKSHFLNQFLTFAFDRTVTSPCSFLLCPTPSADPGPLSCGAGLCTGWKDKTAFLKEFCKGTPILKAGLLFKLNEEVDDILKYFQSNLLLYLENSVRSQNPPISSLKSEVISLPGSSSTLDLTSTLMGIKSDVISLSTEAIPTGALESRKLPVLKSALGLLWVESYPYKIHWDLHAQSLTWE